MDDAQQWQTWKARFPRLHPWSGIPLAGEMVSTSGGSRLEYIAFAEPEGIAVELKIFEVDGIERSWPTSTAELRDSLCALRRSLRDRLACGELGGEDAIVVRLVLVSGTPVHLDHGCYDAPAAAHPREVSELAELVIEDLERRIHELGWPSPTLP